VIEVKVGARHGVDVLGRDAERGERLEERLAA
jgi:hypothetical protein